MIVNGILIDGTACSGEVTIPEGVTSIGDFAFSGCSSMTSITIPDSVKSIGDSAFEWCTGLTSIEIPEGVTSIGEFVFFSCHKLTEVFLENGSKLTSGNLGVDESIIGTYWNEGDLTWTLTADGTMTISGTGAMKDYSYDSPACDNSNIKKVVIEEGVTSIGDSAFSDCRSLTDITIPGSVTSIGYSAFQNTTWLKNKQNESPLVIVNGILIDGRTCSGEVTIPNNVTSIGNYAFYECTGLTSIEIPEGVKSIGANAFSDCTGLTSITIPKSVTSIGDEAFSGTPWLTNKQQDNPLVIVNGILIDGTTCSGEVTIPYGVTSIGNFPFYNCTGLTSISIPKSVTSIGAYTFSGCGNLTEITVPCDSTLTKDAFEDASEKVKYRHSLVKTDAKDATYTEAGNVEYWTCENCKKHFLSDETDAEAAKEVELSATVKPVPVQVATATTQIKCVYGQDMDEIDLQDYVKNSNAVGEVSVKVATGSTMLDGSKLSGKPAKAYTDGKDVTFTFTAKNGNTANLTLHFLVAKADPTVEVTVDGDSHTEGDLVSELKLILSGNNTKGLAEIISEIKALTAGENTLTWKFTPEDDENYNVVTGTVVVNAQTTTTTITTTTTTTTTTNETTSTTKATTATSGTTSATKATTVTSGTTATTKATATTNETTATTEETTTKNETTATTEGTTTTNETSATTEETTATTEETTTTNETITTPEETTTTSEATATTEETIATSETTATTEATTVTTNETTATTEETTTTNETTATTVGTTTTNETTATTATSGTTATTSATQTTTITSASNTESTAVTSATTITTAATTSVTNIADEDLCSWAINDYQKKTGVTPANAKITARSEEACEITLTDENGNVLDVYTVDPKTGTGTDSSNAEVNLPQTGNNAMTNWLLCVGAAMFMAFGFGAVKASGALKRKEDE